LSNANQTPMPKCIVLYPNSNLSPPRNPHATASNPASVAAFTNTSAKIPPAIHPTNFARISPISISTPIQFLNTHSPSPKN